MIRVFHHNDPDGYFSNYFVHRICLDFGDIISYEMDYNTPFPLKVINPKDRIYILDYSIKPEIMDELLKITKDVIWIDHHESAINMYKDYDKEIKGIRKIGECGALLTYKFLCKEHLSIDSNFIPEALFLVNDWDVWHYGNEEFDPRTKNFILGIQTKNLRDIDIIDNICLNVDKYIKKGKAIKEYLDIQNKTIVDNGGFEFELDGKSVFSCNTTAKSSEFFGDNLLKKYDILMPFRYNGKKDIWECGFYSNKENINCGEIASTFGGGGHKGAAGFSVKDIKKIIKSVKDIKKIIKKETL